MWAIDQTLESTGEKCIPKSLAGFAYKEWSDYVHSRSEIDDSFCKHLVASAQSRTFEDPNYVNTIRSKVVIKPLAEALELPVKKDQLLQLTMVSKRGSGFVFSRCNWILPSGETTEASDANAVGYLPSGETPEATAPAASVTGDLPSGERPGS